MDEAALARVEQQRAALETNIANLRKSLRHWQTLEIDYEGLKEEFLGIAEESSIEECIQAARDFKPELVDENELQALLRDNQSRPRRPAQLVDLLSKRVEYVSRNVETVRKQLSDAEKKRNALLLAGEPDHRHDAGLPLSEITEELDDSGEIISSRVETPGSATPQLIDVLKKAGVTDLEETNGTITEAASSITDEVDSRSPLEPEILAAGESPNTSSLQRSTTPASNAAPTLPPNPNDTQEEARLRQEMLDYSRGMDEVGAIVAELDLEEDGSDISYDEHDDAFELDSDVEGDEDFDEEESEDETGKSKNRLLVPRGYRKKMEELQEKLGLKNVAPQADPANIAVTTSEADRPPAAEAARKAAISRYEEATKSSLKSSVKSSTIEKDAAKPGKPSKKKVAFSSELDIAPGDIPTTIGDAPPPASTKDADKPKLRPINESIVERSVGADEEDAAALAPAPPAPAPAATPEGKQSRFKAARQSNPQTPLFAPPMTFPSGPSDEDRGEPASPTPPSKIISTTLVERPSPKATTAPDPNNFSDEAHRREIAMEYQRHRMKRIQSQDGGFVGEGEEDNYGEMITPGRGRAAEDPQERKVSRFKAARTQR
jgi:unconventional prefoldin RPB5 interactor 1